MVHSCQDGTHTKLVRVGPTGTMEGVTFHCPRCGYSKSAIQSARDFDAIAATIVDRLAR